MYGHANGRDIAETSAEVGRYIEMGYKAVRAQSGVPGLTKTYGVSNMKTGYEPAESALPAETVWSTTKYLNTVPQLFERLRLDHGPEVELLHDVHHRLTPIEAARLGRDLEPYRLFWMEDATPADNQAAFETIRRHTVTPLAVGEVFNSIWDCKQLIQQQLIDYIRTTIVHAGGITHVRRIADFAALHQVRTGFHGATDLSPVCMGAALHFDAWVPNFGIQEYMHHSRGDAAGVSARLHVPRRAVVLRREPGAWRGSSMRSWRRAIPIRRSSCRSRGWKTARCGTGECVGAGVALTSWPHWTAARRARGQAAFVVERADGAVGPAVAHARDRRAARRHLRGARGLPSADAFDELAAARGRAAQLEADRAAARRTPTSSALHIVEVHDDRLCRARVATSRPVPRAQATSP